MSDFLGYWLSALFKTGSRYFILASIVFVAFYIVFKTPMMGRKIQQKFPAPTDYYRDILNSVISMTIFAGISVWTLRVIAPYTNLYDNINDYSTTYYVFTLVWMFFLHDAYFYGTHRAMHHPKLFRIIHLTHHKSTNPSPWTAYAFHPLEAILEAAIVPVIAFSIPTHRSAIIMYMFFQISYNIYGHLGFEIMPKNLNRHWLGKWFNTSVAHNMHHQYAVKNYGLWTTIWDRAFGTLDERYDDTYDKATQP